VTFAGKLGIRREDVITGKKAQRNTGIAIKNCRRRNREYVQMKRTWHKLRPGTMFEHLQEWSHLAGMLGIAFGLFVLVFSIAKPAGVCWDISLLPRPTSYEDTTFASLFVIQNFFHSLHSISR
jgi:hypothetical protein